MATHSSILAWRFETKSLLRPAFPKLFWHQGLVSWNTIFPDQQWGDGFRMFQERYIYCALYFYYDYISCTSDHQALDPRGWGPMP